MTTVLKRLHIYVAGPLFSESERRFDEEIANLCEGFDTIYGVRLVVFLPHRDAGLQTDGEDSARQIYAADVAALERADLVVANLDGADVDAGTAWEIGYAVARRRSAIGIRTDRRWLEPFSRVNLMIEQSVLVVTSMQQLENAIYAFLAKASGYVGDERGVRVP